MSIASACEQIQASIGRARSLFGAGDVPPGPEVIGALDVAARCTAGTGTLTNDLSGAVVDRHRSFTNTAAAVLMASADTDMVLKSQLKRAAAVSEAGAARLDALYAQARITSMAAATAETPIAQRAILNALRSHVARTYDALSSTQQRVNPIARRTTSLEYPIDTRAGEADSAQPASYGIGELPGSPILIWCVPVRGGGIGFVCSKQFGNKTIDVYRAPYDESGVLS